MMPKNALTFAPAPMVKKWCSHTSERQEHDRPDGPDHASVAEQSFARERRHDFRKDTECRQHQNINLRMSPRPNQIDIHHGIAAAPAVKKCMPSVRSRCSNVKVTVRIGKAKTTSVIAAKDAPGKHRHLHKCHARRPHFKIVTIKFIPRQQTALHRQSAGPYPIIHTHAGAVLEFDLSGGYASQPAAENSPSIKDRLISTIPASKQPKTGRIHKWKRHIARADLQRQNQVDEAEHQAHSHEENHNRPVG